MSQLKTKVEQWLEQMDCTPVPQADPQAEWHFVIHYPANGPTALDVLAPKGRGNRLLIVCSVEVSHEHREAFDKLDDDGKDDFLWRFRHAINVAEANFALQGAEGMLECPSRFQVSATRYEDGLTLDSFAQTEGSVFKTNQRAIWVIQEHLAPRSFGSGGRFDIKRQGL
jgi:hypothetical protein